MLNPLWCPLIEYIDSNCRGEAPEWTKSLALNNAAILHKHIGIVGSLGDTFFFFEMGTFIDFIQKTLCRFLEVHVPTKLVKTVVGVLVPLNLEATARNY